MKAGLWKGKYAAVNHHEYFAEGVQSWFDDNRENDHDHNHVNTRALNCSNTIPGLAAICREVFGDTESKYTKPATRLTGHLAGYDPAKAPTFVWPERLDEGEGRDPRARRRTRDRQRRTAARDARRSPAGRVHIQHGTAHQEKQAATARALELLKAQLDEIIRVVPAPAVAELQKVPLYFSPEYPQARRRAPSIIPTPAGCATTGAIRRWQKASSSPTSATSKPRRAACRTSRCTNSRTPITTACCRRFRQRGDQGRLRKGESRRQVTTASSARIPRAASAWTAPTR